MNTDDSQNGEFAQLLKAFHSAQECGDFAQAESIGVQCLAFAAEEAGRNPSESLRLVLEAHEHEDAARWELAEAAHRRALLLAEVEGDDAAIFKVHDDLRSLYAIRGMADKALHEALTALKAARKTDMSPSHARKRPGFPGCTLRSTRCDRGPVAVRWRQAECPPLRVT